VTWFYRNCIRPALFWHDSEAIHDFTLNSLGRISRSSVVCEALEALFGAPELPVEFFGLRFPNPVGLAAGMDKRAAAVPAWQSLGFGFTELGGVTWHAQPGNPAPRMFRAEAEAALVNRMGFNNPGAQAMAATLRDWRSSRRWPRHPVGINLGKSKITPLADAAEDYANSFRMLRNLADFFVVNVSSPNTPNLRQLQDKAALDQILEAIQWGADAILLIVAILTDDQLNAFHALAKSAGLAALVEVHDEAVEVGRIIGTHGSEDDQIAADEDGAAAKSHRREGGRILFREDGILQCQRTGVVVLGCRDGEEQRRQAAIRHDRVLP